MTLSFEHTELLYNMSINLSLECVHVSVGTVHWGTHDGPQPVLVNREQKP